MRMRLSYYKRHELTPDETSRAGSDGGIWVSAGWIDARDRREAVRIVEARTGVTADDVRIDAVEE